MYSTQRKVWTAIPADARTYMPPGEKQAATDGLGKPIILLLVYLINEWSQDQSSRSRNHAIYREYYHVIIKLKDLILLTDIKHLIYYIESTNIVKSCNIGEFRNNHMEYTYIGRILRDT